MLSTLISLLRRIPAVKWAFTRLRPTPQGGSIEATPVAADVSPVIAADIAAQQIAEAASIDTSETCTISARDDAEIAAAAPCAADDAATSVIAESPPAMLIEACVSDDCSAESPFGVEPLVEAETSVPGDEIDSPAEAVPEGAVSNEPVVEIAMEAVSIDAEPVAIDAVGEPDDSAALVADDGRSPDVIMELEPTVDAPCVPSAAADRPVEPVAETHADSDLSPGERVAVAPIAAENAAPVTAMIVAPDFEQAASVATGIAPVLVSPSSDLGRAPKLRARPAEPVDRAALIRQRWAESGIRMWNPRLHGSGEATLNIQGSIGLLPPAPGETMPRYDKLEFSMLGGQIVCEGVIVEAPAQASHRSFTRLAESGKVERAREPARERQAALA